MNIGLYGILIIFGAFVILLIFNPKVSCFGKRLKSPFYPLQRKKVKKSRTIQPDDYGFDLGGQKKSRTSSSPKQSPSGKKIRTEDYGFNLGDEPQPREETQKTGQD